MTLNALLSTEWVDLHRDDPDVRIVESNEDPLVYRAGHIPGAIEIDWIRDLNHPVRRDVLSSEAFSALCSESGISRDTLVVFYGDKNNWWSCYSFWVFALYGHPRLAIMDGGKILWEQQRRDLSREKPSISREQYPLQERNDQQERIFREQVLTHIQEQASLVDVRTPEEFSGKMLHMPDYPNEGAVRGGHIPGAKNIPWANAINRENGTFRSKEELLKIYCKDAGLNPEDPHVVYCRIGERSSHTWFVLKYLLEFRNVRNYDGSWTEWGNLVGVPIERVL